MAVDSNPARVKAREVVQTRRILIMEYSNTLSIETQTRTSPN
jgi:hypothetical protein